MNLSIKYDFCGTAPLGIGFAQSHRKRGYHAEILNFPQGVGVDGRALVSEKHKKYDALRRGFILANLNGTPTKGISFNEIIQMLRERKAGKPFFLRFYEPVACAHVVEVQVKRNRLGVNFKPSEHAIYCCELDTLNQDEPGSIEEFNRTAPFPVRPGMVLSRINHKSCEHLPFAKVIEYLSNAMLGSSVPLMLVFRLPTTIRVENCTAEQFRFKQSLYSNVEVIESTRERVESGMILQSIETNREMIKVFTYDQALHILQSTKTPYHLTFATCFDSVEEEWTPIAQDDSEWTDVEDGI